MSHIHTGPGEHDETITAFIIRTDGSEPKALLHMHRKHNKLMPVGGHVEPNQTRWQAIAAEVVQESGYELSQLSVLQPKDRIRHLPKIILHPYPVVLNTHDISPDHDHADTAFAFVTDQDPMKPLEADESQDLRWLAHSEVSALTEAETFLNAKVIYDFIFKVCLEKWEAVPATDFQA